MKHPLLILSTIFLTSCGQGNFVENSTTDGSIPKLKSVSLSNGDQFEGEEKAEIELLFSKAGVDAFENLAVSIDFIATGEDSVDSTLYGVSSSQFSISIPVGGCGNFEGQKYPLIRVRDFVLDSTRRYFLDESRSATYYTIESNIYDGMSENTVSEITLSNIRIPFISYTSNYDKNDMADLSLMLGKIYRSDDDFYGLLYTLSVVIANLGTRPAYVDGIRYASDDESFAYSRNKYVRSRCLKPGDEFVTALEFSEKETNDFGYLMLDGDNQIEESNENNNKSDYIDWGSVNTPLP